MPKKKKRPRKPVTRRQPTQHPNRVLEDYRVWRLAAEKDLDAVWLVDALIDLKRDHLDSPDPTVWTAEDLEVLLTEIVPRKVLLHGEDQDRMLPTVSDYLEFLHATGRWSPRSIPHEALPDVLADLSRTVPKALRDPTRRTMGGNILAMALAEGVDPADEAEMAGFIDRYNAMDQDTRTAVTDGRAPGPSGAPRLAAVPDLPEDDEWEFTELDGIWPEYLGEPIDMEQLFNVMPEAGSEAEFYAGSVLLRRADRLLTWLGTGRKVTDTGALRRADTAEALKLLDIGTATPKSMWDVPAIAGLWGGLISSRFVELDGGMARANAGVYPWPGPRSPAEDRAEAGAFLHATVLMAFLDDTDHSAPAMIPPLTFLALLKATEPDGLHLPEPARLVEDLDVYRIRHDLRVLSDIGIVTTEGDTFRLSPVLIPALGATLHAISAGLADQ